MELVKLCTYLNVYDKIYDSKLSYDDNENTKLVSSIQSEILPGCVINIILKDINLNTNQNNKLYMHIIKFIEKNINHHIKIYIDNWGEFRRIIISKNSKVETIVNLYF